MGSKTPSGKPADSNPLPKADIILGGLSELTVGSRDTLMRPTGLETQRPPAQSGAVQGGYILPQAYSQGVLTSMYMIEKTIIVT